MEMVAYLARLTNSSMVGTVISLATSLPQLETLTMLLSFSVRKIVGYKALSSVITLLPKMSNLEL